MKSENRVLTFSFHIVMDFSAAELKVLVKNYFSYCPQARGEMIFLLRRPMKISL